MFRFHAYYLILVERDLDWLFSQLQAMEKDGLGGKTLDQGIHDFFVGKTKRFLPSLQKLPLPDSVQWNGKRLANDLAQTGPTISALSTRIVDLRRGIATEMDRHVFLMVDAERRKFYEQEGPLFGAPVADTFPEASYDISAAGRCLALDEWTAAVFHLMRVLEKGLRWLAGEVGVEMSPDAELDNWRVIIDRIETKIKAMQELPKSAERSVKSQFYSEAATNFYYFKEAWRNHVSHSRATYDERQAMEIWNHVRSFIRRLAKGPIPREGQEQTLS